MNAQTVNAHRGMLLTLPNVKSRSIVKRACAALPLVPMWATHIS